MEWVHHPELLLIITGLVEWPHHLPSMLLPRGLTKKKLDTVSVKRRRIEDKERPFKKAIAVQPVQDPASTQNDFTLEQAVWTNAVYLSLFDSRFSSDDLKLVRRPVTECEPCSQFSLLYELRGLSVVTCHSVAIKAKLTDVAPIELVGALRQLGEERIQIRLALDTNEAEAGSAFEFRLLDTDGNEVTDEIIYMAYLVRYPVSKPRSQNRVDADWIMCRSAYPRPTSRSWVSQI